MSPFEGDRMEKFIRFSFKIGLDYMEILEHFAKHHHCIFIDT